MTDFSARFANRLETAMAEQSSPATEMVNARLQRIEELERIRLERQAAHSQDTPTNASGRLERRERLIRQTTQGITRSTERRNFAPTVQRTPVHRSQSFDTTSAVMEDTVNFRETFESTRQNLFGPRVTASSDNIPSLYGRRLAERNLTATRENLAQEPDSGSSTPVRSRPTFDLTAGIAEAFSSVRSSLTRSSDTTREYSRPTVQVTESVEETQSQASDIQRYVSTTPLNSSLTRTSSLRDTSRRESRFRRRTIQGVDSNVSQALERDRVERTSSQTRSMLRSSSITRNRPGSLRSNGSTQNGSSDHTSNLPSTVQESSVTNSSYSSSSYESYSYSGRRPIEICPENTAPVLGFEDDRVVFVDNDGHLHWLSKHHQLARFVKNGQKEVPEIVIKNKITSDDKESEGYIATIEGDEGKRIERLRELVFLAKIKDSDFKDLDVPDTSCYRSLSLLELYQRGDVVDQLQQSRSEEKLDEKYKSYSLYTPPRPKPDMEEYLATRVVVPLYDGIDVSVFEEEKKVEHEENTEFNFDNRPPLVYELSATRFAASQRASSSYTSSNGVTTATQERRQEARQESVSYRSDRDSGTTETQTMSYRNVEHSSYSSITSRGSDNDVGTNGRGFDNVHDSTVEHDENTGVQALADDDSSNSEVGLVMERLHMMEAATGTQIDTSNLSYEELLSIQKALEDNPSPPETPPASPFEEEVSPASRGIEEVVEYFQPVQEPRPDRVGRVTQPSAPTVMAPLARQETDITESPRSAVAPLRTAAASRRILPPTPESDRQRPRNLETITRQRQQSEQSAVSRTMASNDGRQVQQTVEQAFSQAVAESITGENIRPGDTSQIVMSMSSIEHTSEGLSATETITDKNKGETQTNVSRQRSITNTTSESVFEGGTSTSQSSTQSSTQSSSTRTTAQQRLSKITGFTPRLQRISSSGSESSPRLQRLSSGGSDAKLPLPSMNFSPLDKTKPIQKFTFNEVSAPKSPTASGSDSREPKASTSDDQSTNQQASSSVSQTGTTVHSELTIQIPESSATSPSHSACRRSSGGTPKSASSPHVLSSGNNSCSSGGVSPAGSDGVTTVFEEFVQTIPPGLLKNWSPNDDR